MVLFFQFNTTQISLTSKCSLVGLIKDPGPLWRRRGEMEKERGIRRTQQEEWAKPLPKPHQLIFLQDERE
jgi:hypothetical protein